MVHEDWEDIVFKENRLFDPIEPKCDSTERLRSFIHEPKISNIETNKIYLKSRTDEYYDLTDYCFIRGE